MTREEIITKKFPHSLLGYDIAAVDKFLDEIIREMDRLHAELSGLTRELSGSTAESVIEEADRIELMERERKSKAVQPPMQDDTYSDFVPDEKF